MRRYLDTLNKARELKTHTRMPKVVGVTASLLNSAGLAENAKSEVVEAAVVSFLASIGARKLACIWSPEARDELARYVAKPTDRTCFGFD